MKNDLLKQIDDICEKTRFFFCSRYFGKGVIGYWEGNIIATKLHVDGYTFTIEDMLEFLRGNASRNQMFEYISYIEEQEQLNRDYLNFKSWKTNQK